VKFSTKFLKRNRLGVKSSHFVSMNFYVLLSNKWSLGLSQVRQHPTIIAMQPSFLSAQLKYSHQVATLTVANRPHRHLLPLASHFEYIDRQAYPGLSLSKLPLANGISIASAVFCGAHAVVANSYTDKQTVTCRQTGTLLLL